MPRNNASFLAQPIIYQSPFPPRLEKKYFLCTVPFPLSGRNWNSKKLPAEEGCIYSIYTSPSRHLPTASPQVRQLMLSFQWQRHLQVVAAAWRKVVLSLRPTETEQGFSIAAQKSSHHKLILTWPLTHITLALPSWGRWKLSWKPPLELQSKITHTHMLPQCHCQNMCLYLFILSKGKVLQYLMLSCASKNSWYLIGVCSLINWKCF